LLAYGTNLNKIHLVKLPELTQIQEIEEDGDLTTLGAGTINDEVHLVVGIEDSGVGLVSVWNLNTLQKISTFPVHNGYIWTII
jgi:hypothetical protein